jgi:HlyD family type I secretion membrane fusion protein
MSTAERVSAASQWAQAAMASLRRGVRAALEALSPKDERLDSQAQFMAARSIVARGRLAIILFLAGFLAWAWLAPLHSAILASGVIVVETHRKTIQHLEGGIVSSVKVVDGQYVHANQVLVVLDDTQAKANLDLLDGENVALMAEEARLAAERDGAAEIAFSRDITSRLTDPKVASAVQGEENAFATRRATLAKQIDILNKRSAENGRIIAGLQKEQASIEEQIALVERETQSVQALFDKGLSTLPRLLALQRQLADLSGQRGQVIERIAQTELASGENELQVANLKNQTLSDEVKDLRDVQTKRFDLSEKLTAARDILARTAVRAPVAGRIVSLSVHAANEVLKPGDVLMEIVPQHDALEVEAHVRPEDADGVHVGMQASVNLNAYERRRLPIINGVVSDISADRIVDQRTGQAYFKVMVTVDRSALHNYPDVRLMPGLPVEVDLSTGTRTMIEYLIEPITDVLRRGMRER